MTGERVRVLLVEDSPEDVRIVRRLLTDPHARYEIAHWTRLEEALEAAAREPFDVMLLDLSLPDASGMETLERAREAVPRLPIVVMTGLGDETVELQAMEQGAQDYLVKGEIDAALLQRSLHYAIGRTRTQLALAESEERYALALQGANDGLWDWQLKQNYVHFSPRWKSMLAYGADDVGDAPDEWFDRIHVDDVNGVRSALEDHLAGRTEAFESEYRMRCRDGSYRWMLARGLAVRGEDGQATRVAGSQTDITRSKQVERQLQHGVFHDAPTGLPNRALVVERLERAMLRQKQEGRRFAVLAVQLDHYGSIITSHGAATCDEFIGSVARRLAQCLQPEDTLARVERDQFCLLVEGLRDTADAVRLAERIQRELQRPERFSNEELFTTVSVGITTSDAPNERPEEHLRDAAVAMHRAQELGGGRHQVFDVPMHQDVVARLQLEAELRHGIVEDEFRIYYQPIVWLESGEVAGFEALLRWQHPTRGLLAPGAFLAVAEGAGLMSAICDFILPGALDQASEWHQALPGVRPVFVNINLSPGEFALPHLLARIDAALECHPVPPFTLGIEMMESMVIKDDESVLALLNEMKARKLRLLLDDFGTGYSSLDRLHRFPIDTLKIDKSFLAQLRGRTGSAEIVRAIVTLAQSLGMGVTAEGIETPDQLSFVKGLGCELGQGFYFAQALPAEEATKAIGRGFSTGLSRPSLRPPGSVRKSRGRVLLVDADAASRKMMREVLNEQEFEVVLASTGPQCLELAAQAHPEVILLDLRMPGMDGIETCRRLKQSAETTNIPVLFATNVGDGDPLTLEALSAGGSDFVSKGESSAVLSARLASQIEISRAQAKLHRLAMTDELTGVFSRRFLFDSLRRAVKATSRVGETGIVCLLVDVDHFRQVNDTRGHMEGDRVLAKIAQTIDGHTRDTDVVARFGGEEFIVLLSGTDLRGASVVAEKIRSAVALGCGASISVGGAWLESAPVEILKSKGEVDKLIDRLLQQADMAMADAKQLGRNRVVLCSEPVTALEDWAPISQR